MPRPLGFKLLKNKALLTRRQHDVRLMWFWLYTAAWFILCAWIFLFSDLAVIWRFILAVPLILGTPALSDLWESYEDYKRRWELDNEPTDKDKMTSHD